MMAFFPINYAMILFSREDLQGFLCKNKIDYMNSKSVSVGYLVRGLPLFSFEMCVIFCSSAVEYHPSPPDVVS
jgi:hypothetical protein